MFFSTNLQSMLSTAQNSKWRDRRYPSIFALTSQNARTLRTNLYPPCWKANMLCDFDQYEKYRMSGNHGINQRIIYLFSVFRIRNNRLHNDNLTVCDHNNLCRGERGKHSTVF